MRLLAVIALAVLPACTPAERDLGGRVDEYQARAQYYTWELPKMCGSSCTMFLYKGCVTPEHRLLFHGPRKTLFGIASIPLAPDEFEEVSQGIAAYYPPAIRDKYLEEWRYEIEGYVEISGQQAIDMGATQCE